MKKFILLIALSALFYSVPGHADQERKKAAKEVAKKRRAARVAAAIAKTAAAKARAERQKAEAGAGGPSHQDTRRKSITAALAAASEATLERRQAALESLEASVTKLEEQASTSWKWRVTALQAWEKKTEEAYTEAHAALKFIHDRRLWNPLRALSSEHRGPPTKIVLEDRIFSRAEDLTKQAHSRAEAAQGEARRAQTYCRAEAAQAEAAAVVDG